MSTRGMYTFIDEDGSQYHVYKHHDSYPDGKCGAISHIEKASNFAWLLPRFEADEFAAAFVAAHKIPNPDVPAQIRGGEIRLMESGNWREVASGDISYRYEISLKNNNLYIEAYNISCNYPFNYLAEKLIFSGTLDEAKAKYITEIKESPVK